MSAQPVSISAQTITDMEAATRRTERLWLLALLALMGLAAAISWAWTGRTADAQLQSILQTEAQIADSRAADVADWIASQRASIDKVAANPSLVPYLASGEDADLGAYVQTYIRDIAERDGFTRGVSQVPANVARAEGPGLAILDAQGRVLIGVGGPLPSADDLIARTGDGGLVLDGATRLKAGTALRLLRPLAAGGMEARYVYGVRLLDDDLLARLAQPGEPVGVANQSLLTRRGARVIAVTHHGDYAAGENVAADPGVQAALKLMPATADVRDVVKVRFLETARAIKGSDWILVRARPAGVLLGDTLWKRILSLAALLGIIGLGGVFALLGWRQAASARLAEHGAREAQSRQFLATISDSQPTGIYVIDAAGAVQFTNATAQKWPPLDRTPLADLIAAARAGRVGTPVTLTHDGRRLQIEACPLDPQHPQDNVLLIAEDMTELVQAHDRQQASQQALVSTLTGLIDARDPGSRGHSRRVSRVATAIGAALQMTAADINTLTTAGELMNLGKILVPTALLTKSAPLTDDERAQVRTAMAKTSTLLARVPFDGPVAATLEELEQEMPRSRLGAVLRLANNFVGQVSPRAHRPPIGIDDALANLRRSGFDAALVSALAYWLDSQDGRAQLAEL